MSGQQFGILPVPYPDENCYSIMCRFAVRHGQTSNIQIIHELLGNITPLDSYVFKPFRLRDIRRWYGTDEIHVHYVEKFSCYPFYNMFLRPTFAAKVKESVIGTSMTVGQAKRINRECGFSQGHKKSLWYCPECVREDVLLHGETCWRRLPQMPGAVYCPIHEVKLRESGVSFRDIKYNLIPANYAMNHIPEPDPEPGNVYSDRYISLAKDIAWLLDKGFQFSDSEWVKRSYFEITGSHLTTSFIFDFFTIPEWADHFEEYLAAKIMKDCGKERIYWTIRKQIATILCIKRKFGTVEKFYSS